MVRTLTDLSAVALVVQPVDVLRDELEELALRVENFQKSVEQRRLPLLALRS